MARVTRHFALCVTEGYPVRKPFTSPKAPSAFSNDVSRQNANLIPYQCEVGETHETRNACVPVKATHHFSSPIVTPSLLLSINDQNLN